MLKGYVMKRLILLAVLLAGTAQAQTIDPAVQARIDRILKATPLVDGHNDLPWELRDNHGSRVETTDFANGSDTRTPALQTDIARMHKGRMGAQFWSIWIPAKFSGPRAVEMTLEQVDIVKRMVAKYPRDLEWASTADDIVRIHKAGRIGSLMGIEGGHQIDNNLAALRQFYALGVRYMTLTHTLNNDWADSATDDPKHGGLTPFGLKVIAEMNRLGMLVDLSHVAPTTMAAALKATRAPVIFSHSDARALSDHPRNVPDEVLRLLPANGGVVMVNFYPGHLSAKFRVWSADRAAEEARQKALLNGRPDLRSRAMDAWDTANPRPVTPIAEVADHIEHVAKIAGIDHVGIGGDLDGIDVTVPGLGGADGYPNLFAELIRRGWSDADLAKLAGSNVLRAMRGAEAVAASMKGRAPEITETAKDI
jgi:membrane dipeptidase